MEMDFANACPLVRPVLPRIRFLFVGSRLCSTLPSDGPSRFRPCASLVLHLHQVTQGTFTPKLSDMSDTHAGLRPPPTAADGIDRGCHTAAICLQEVDGKVRSAYPPQISCQKISLRHLYADPDRHPHGHNAVTGATRRRILARIGHRLTDPLIAILIVAGLVSGLTGNLASCAIIFAILSISIALERGRNSTPGYHCSGEHLVEGRGSYCLNRQSELFV